MTVETFTAEAEEGISNPSGQPAPEAEARPEWLPEQFKTPEDMAKSYGEVQGAYTRSQQELAELKKSDGTSDDDTSNPEKGPAPQQLKVDTPKPTQGSDQDTDDAKGDEDKSSEDAPKGDLSKVTQEDLVEYSQEFWDNGELSEESYEKLEGLGLPKWMVDSYAEGQVSLVGTQKEAVFNAAGGEDQVGKIFEWAGKALDPEDVATYNKQLDSPDQNTRLVAISGLKARYDAAGGPSMVTGANAPTSGGTFQSVAEVQKAMNDPRYQSDPAYRDSVARRLEHSTVI